MAELSTLGYTGESKSSYASLKDRVQQFQLDYGLPPTGLADRITRDYINRALLKRRIVFDAMHYLRVPYVWGGQSPSGFDCSGFVYYMLKKHNIPVNRTTSQIMFTWGEPVERSKLQEGDLVFFRTTKQKPVSHVGIYLGDHRFISATASEGIAIDSLKSSYWGQRYVGARRVY
nr:NlpC/P60 family protein [Paenibacillus turpanensis]